MSRLSKFLGEPKIIELNGEELKVYPLKVKDLTLFRSAEEMSNEEKLKLNRDLIKKSLTDENATDEEIDNLSIKSFMILMNAINEVNGLNEENDKIAAIRRSKEQVIQKTAK